ncbi:Oxidoreductase, molybdopterin-binding domain-containing protein [Phellopilus nigrolimitatus]|nr:Oxidoreductase, molybdopterin-binding domain-containing protein [Phellopilus nigrolimitatus]
MRLFWSDCRMYSRSPVQQQICEDAALVMGRAWYGSALVSVEIRSTVHWGGFGKNGVVDYRNHLTVRYRRRLVSWDGRVRHVSSVEHVPFEDDKQAYYTWDPLSPVCRFKVLRTSVCEDGLRINACWARPNGVASKTRTSSRRPLPSLPSFLSFSCLVGADTPHTSQVELTVTLQCSGTRRIEQIAEYPGDGDELINAPWGEGVIGTAVYKGVPLKKVLKIACGGVLPECKHLEFIGADTYFKKGQVFNYAVSAPWRKVRMNEEVLLAYEMNGQPLPKIHGAPLRVVVTGYIGARSCKWVYRVNALAEPSMGPVQRQEYLYYTQQIGKQNAKYSNGFSIQNMPVSSAIIHPTDKQMIVHDGTVKLEGWAYSGSGNWVERVEVSPDGGHVWYAVPEENLTEKHYFAWRLWHIELPVDAEGGLDVRTWDSSNNTEPMFVRSAWNWDLHVTSSCHRIKLYSVNCTRAQTAARLRLLN